MGERRHSAATVEDDGGQISHEIWPLLQQHSTAQHSTKAKPPASSACLAKGGAIGCTADDRVAVLAYGPYVRYVVSIM